MFALMLVWLAGVGTSIAKVLFVVGLVLAIVAGGGYVVRSLIFADALKYFPAERMEPSRPNKRTAIWVTSLGVILMLAGAAIPSEKTAYMMGGAYLGQKALQSETAGKVVELFNQKLDSYIQEASKEVDGKVKEKISEVVGTNQK